MNRTMMVMAARNVNSYQSHCQNRQNQQIVKKRYEIHFFLLSTSHTYIFMMNRSNEQTKGSPSPYIIIQTNLWHTAKPDLNQIYFGCFMFCLIFTPFFLSFLVLVRNSLMEC